MGGGALPNPLDAGALSRVAPGSPDPGNLAHGPVPEQRTPVSVLASLFWVGLAILVIGGALRLRARLREPLGRQWLVDDDAIRAIEVTGRLEVDDELDPAEIEEEERRFLEEDGWE